MNRKIHQCKKFSWRCCNIYISYFYLIVFVKNAFFAAAICFSPTTMIFYTFVFIFMRRAIYIWLWLCFRLFSCRSFFTASIRFSPHTFFILNTNLFIFLRRATIRTAYRTIFSLYCCVNWFRRWRCFIFLPRRLSRWKPINCKTVRKWMA